MECSEITLADACMFEKVRQVIHKSILQKCQKLRESKLESYFLERESDQNILRHINCGRLYLLKKGGEVIGTATLYRNSIQQIYILQEHENSFGATKFILTLESIMRKTYDNIMIDSFFADPSFYMKLGYTPKNPKSLVGLEEENILYFTLGKKIKVQAKVLWDHYKIKNFTLDYFSDFRLFRNELMYEKIDDYYDSLPLFLKYYMKNPTTNFLLFWKQKVVGVILCGTDGRRGYVNLIQLLQGHQMEELTYELISVVLTELAETNIKDVALTQRQSNVDIGFVETMGFERIDDSCCYQNEISPAIR